MNILLHRRFTAFNCCFERIGLTTCHISVKWRSCSKSGFTSVCLDSSNLVIFYFHSVQMINCSKYHQSKHMKKTLDFEPRDFHTLLFMQLTGMTVVTLENLIGLIVDGLVSPRLNVCNRIVATMSLSHSLLGVTTKLVRLWFKIMETKINRCQFYYSKFTSVI